MKKVYSKKEYTEAIKDAGAVIALEVTLEAVINEYFASGLSFEDITGMIMDTKNNISEHLYTIIELDKSEQFSLDTMINDTIISDNREATEIK